MADSPHAHRGSFPQPEFRAEPRAHTPLPSERGPRGPERLEWRTNLVLFVLTTFSVFYVGAFYWTSGEGPPAHSFADTLTRLDELPRGWTFAVPLLTILLFHEFGHWIAARLHGVDASLPYFLPLPLISPFGTLGAVIAFRERIVSRNALMDIGAAGPLAGMVVAIPVIMIGLSLSPVGPLPNGDYSQEGQSLLYLFLKYLVLGPIPDGHDVLLHPTAVAGWAGLLVTMLNLLPWGQLDGGHVAYALFGSAQDKIGRVFRYLLLLLVLYNVAQFSVPVLLGESDMPLSIILANSNFWFVWFLLIGAIGWISKLGDTHPPTEPGALTRGRKIVGWFTMGLFVVLFMPTPWAAYVGPESEIDAALKAADLLAE